MFDRNVEYLKQQPSTSLSLDIDSSALPSCQKSLRAKGVRSGEGFPDYQLLITILTMNDNNDTSPHLSTSDRSLNIH